MVMACWRETLFISEQGEMGKREKRKVGDTSERSFSDESGFSIMTNQAYDSCDRQLIIAKCENAASVEGRRGKDERDCGTFGVAGQDG
jgi:hypothetical protein